MACGHTSRLVHVLILVLLVTFTSGKDCFLHDQCSCQFDDGSGAVDITSLGSSNGTARFLDVLNSDENIYYSYNPCGAFSEGQCQNAAACMSNTDKSKNTVIGNSGNAMFKFDGGSGNVEVAYTAGTGVLILTTVELVCDPTACDPVFESLGQQGPNQYKLKVTSVCACPGKCTASGTSTCVSAGVSLSCRTILALVLLIMVGAIVSIVN